MTTRQVWCVNTGHCWCAISNGINPTNIEPDMLIHTECGEELTADKEWLDMRIPTCQGCLRTVTTRVLSDATAKEVPIRCVQC